MVVEAGKLVLVEARLHHHTKETRRLIFALNHTLISAATPHIPTQRTGLQDILASQNDT